MCITHAFPSLKWFFGEVKKGYWRWIPVTCKFVFEKSFQQKSDMELFEQEQEVNILRI